MTFKDGNPEMPTNFIMPVLENSQYPQGMQNKKMERQAVKGLTPKYCYLRLNADTSVAWANVIPFDKTDTNDNRMTQTANWITIPQTWLRLITWACYVQVTAGNQLWFLLTKNGWPDLWTTTTPLLCQSVVTNPDLPANLTMPVFLQQWDIIRMEVLFSPNTGSKTVSKDYTTLRAISYILY